MQDALLLLALAQFCVPVKTFEDESSSASDNVAAQKYPDIQLCHCSYKKCLCMSFYLASKHCCRCQYMCVRWTCNMQRSSKLQGLTT